jgi:hypothetical protein
LGEVPGDPGIHFWGSHDRCRADDVRGVLVYAADAWTSAFRMALVWHPLYRDGGVLLCLYLLRYGSAITRIPESGQAAMEEALRQQKTFWKYIGIFAIVVLVLYVFFFIGGIAAAIIIGAMHHPE